MCTSTSPGRPPPPSAHSTTGKDCACASCNKRSVFWWLRMPCVPASTVASYANTAQREASGPNHWPLMLPRPVTMPSAGVLACRSSKLRRRVWAAMARAPYSTQLPSSTRSVRFSRAVALCLRSAPTSTRSRQSCGMAIPQASSNSAKNRSAPALSRSATAPIRSSNFTAWQRVPSHAAAFSS